MKGLPLAYNKDLQEDKEPIFDTVETVKVCLRIFTDMMKSAKFIPIPEKELEAKMAKILDDHKTLIDINPEESQPKSETKQIPVSD